MNKRRYVPFVAVVMVSLITVLGLVTADTSHRVNPTFTRNEAPSSPGAAPRKTAAAVSKLIQAADSSTQLDTLSLHVARRDHTATTLADGKVVIIGGENQNGPVGDVEVIDPSARLISVASQLITARVNHSATLLPDGRVLVAGGSNTRGSINSTEIFDPATNSFTSGPNLRRSRKAHTATLLEDGGILIAGGNEDRTAEVLNLSQQRSKLLTTTMTVPRAFHSAIRLQTGKVLLVGGIGYYNGDTVEVFNPKDQSFLPARNWLNVNRVRPSLRMLPDGKIQIIGGDEKGTMELFNPSPTSIRDYVDLTTTSDIVPSRQMLSAQTRTAFIDAALKQKQNEQSNLMHSPNVSIKAAGWDGQNSAYEAIARANYAYAEVTQKNLSVIAGGVDSKGQFLRSVVLLDSSGASVTTDSVEYEQQARPVLNGAGWMPHEQILIVRQKVETGERIVLDGIADSQGAFTSGQLTGEGNQLGVYILTAVGQSSNYVAQTAYRIAGAFNPQAKTPYTKPFRVKALIPVGAESGTIQTELGPMNWKATPIGNMKFISANKAKGKKGGELSAQASITYPLYSFELPWSNVSFPIPSTPLSIENSSGLLTGDISVELKAVFDAGCVACGECCVLDVCIPCPVLPSASADAYILGSFDLHTVNDIVFQGTFVKNDILLFPFIGIEVSIPETPFKVSATAGLYAGINLSSDRQVKVRPTIDFKNLTIKSGVGIGFEFVPPDFHFGPFNKISPPDSIDGDFEVLTFGDLCAKLTVGPGLNASFSFGDISICTPAVSATARIAAFVKGCVTPVKDTATCEIFNIDISVGAQLDFTAEIKCGIVAKKFAPELELVDIPVKSLGPIYFKDNGPPAITVPSNIVQSTDPARCTAVVTFTATAEDDCSGLATFSCSPATGSTFAKGTTTVKCDAADNKGTTSTASFTVTVNDTEKPKIAACPSNITKATDTGQCSAVTVYTPPGATDNCSATVNCSPSSNTAFAKGTTTVTCTATDPSGNTDSCSFTVTVNDQEAPRIGPCPNIPKFTDPGLCSAVTTFSPPVSDNCPGSSYVCTPPSGSTFPKGVTTVNCTATDAVGNQTPCSFNVTVTDNEAPGITGESASPSTLWEPPHTMSAITVSYGTTDNCGASSNTTRLAVVSNEPDNGLGDGDKPNDIEILDAHHVRLRSERSGKGNGRIYTISIIVTDTSNNVTTKTVRVVVPKNQK